MNPIKRRLYFCYMTRPTAGRVPVSCCWILLVILVVTVSVPSMRNLLVPRWPSVYNDMSTFKVINMYLSDLVFQVDTAPFMGSCRPVLERLTTVTMPRLSEMTVYQTEDWRRFRQGILPILTSSELRLLDKFQPSLTPQEQRYLMFALLSATQALAAFNVTYLVRGGSLIGYYRHHGRLPWDEDIDLLVDAQQWELAKTVLSCLPDLEIHLGADYMWKLFHKRAAPWKDETDIKFPYVDIFLYRYDSDHLWPLTIWMKMVTMKTSWTLPPALGVFEGWLVSVPRMPGRVLRELYPGRIMSDCYSQVFNRRQRRAVSEMDRAVIPCAMLRSVYPYVIRRLEGGKIVEERWQGSRRLSNFTVPYQGGILE